MPRLVIGSHNKKKLVELSDLLKDLPFEVVNLDSFMSVEDVEETGTTFEENARLKAVAYAKATGQWTLAEDSGLVVPALKGRPGVYSARYAGTHGDDAANNKKLLAELAPLPADRRAAYYVCVAILAAPDGEVKAVSEGRCNGVILTDARGTGGFGYDPLFLIPEFHQTFGELSLRVKQALSHRAKAVAGLRPALRAIANNQ
ncbi:RdgB/HAM1 family non-canonical purine NTP pyrophosphatase [Zavarzinella formosa]|uniref:RdgB/HAM1 family non-canonical purine NTP pyrophosphatase n=1 Tax=Zavarzinella formosa TaxID=360055 RepID=UPI0002E87382|nr:RdgB/HAM1 family non-canonical purine NTP pyrophosphatase [Zavarzinella formosa]